MKKLNKKGFTLIELLAVIVIMGILMMVAIPAMTKVIENSRKDTFIETAQTYANTVSTLWYADGLTCGSDVASAVGEGTYYIGIDTAAPEGYPSLIERGGKSSWGNADVKGYVKVVVTGEDNKAKFYVALTDNTHGIAAGDVLAEKLTRKDVKLNMTDFNANVKVFTSATELDTTKVPKGAKYCTEN